MRTLDARRSRSFGGRSRRGGRRSIDWGQRRGRRRSWRGVGLLLAVLVVLAVAAGALQLARSVPAPSFRGEAPARLVVPGAPPVLPWPAGGQATVAVAGIGSLGSSGGSSPLPIASLAKVMTAYLVLHDHPLAPGQSGPVITMTTADAAGYFFGAADNQSVLRVRAGEQLTERQTLEALLVGSANNIGLALARWDAGSPAAFVAKMNREAAALGFTATHYADPIGLDPATVSNAADQVSLAVRALADPVFASIVAEPVVDLPVAGRVYNYNYLVGHDGIVGIKTGSTNVAGGCFVFAAHRVEAGRDQLIVGAVIGQRGRGSILEAALSASQRLIDAAGAVVRPVTVAPPAEAVGTIRAPWGRSVPVRAAGGATFLGWPGLTVGLAVSGSAPGTNVLAGARVGTVTYRLGTQTASVPAEAAATLSGPSWSWRLRRT